MLAVVLFHGDVPPFTGGYIGVDVFFVISGYLITTILLPDEEGHRIGFGEFYERRVRRILPALFTVIGVCFVAAWLFLFPDQFETFAKSAVATILLVSNFFFRAQATGYFSQPVELNPLLHTWSLAVEEQFYLIYPVFLVAVRRLDRQKMVMAIGGAAFVSFTMAQWAIGAHVKAAFYMAPPRAWEFLMGTLLAIDAIPALTTRTQRELASLVGGLLLCWPIFAFTSQTAFPGFNALFPCLGTALIIHAGSSGSSVATKLLQTGPLARIGRLSYSLYLWHWPLIVFCRQYFSNVELTSGITASIIGASFLLAWLSWRFIEQPIRNRRKMGLRRVSLLTGAPAALGLLFGALVIVEAGFPARLPPDIAVAAAAAKDRDPRSTHCIELGVAQAVRDPICRLGIPDPYPPTFLLWGDSHAGALVPALDEAAIRQNLAGIFTGRSSCPPLLGVEITGGKGNRDCRAFNDQVMDYLQGTPAIETVILAGRWAIYAEGRRYGLESGETILIADGETPSPSLESDPAVFARSLKRTVTALETSGKRVILVGPIPEVGWDVPKSLAMRHLTGFGSRLAPTLTEFLDRQKHVFAAFAALPESANLSVIYPHKPLCASGTCRIVDGNVPLYFDDDHLSARGAKSISALFDPALAGKQGLAQPRLARPTVLPGAPANSASKK